MAQYPSAVISFTTKNAGDTIQPSHVNTIQDEITALEDGLLNGTAPVNSSRITAPSAQITNCTISSLTVTSFNFPANSTLTNVNVTGGSTLASLSVSGGSTLADLVVVQPPPTAIVSNATNINVASGSTTRLTFTAQTFVSPAGLHSTSANPSRVTLASSGVWLAVASITWGANSSGDRTLRLLVNGTAFVSERIPPVNGDFTQQTVSGLAYVTDTASYLEAEVIQDSGSTLSVVGATSPATFSVAKLR